MSFDAECPLFFYEHTHDLSPRAQYADYLEIAYRKTHIELRSP